jgi:hypothetical protein
LGDTQIFHAGNLVRRAPNRARLTRLFTRHCPDHAGGSCKSNAGADDTFAKRILKRADGLIAVSENTRQDAIRCWASGLNASARSIPVSPPRISMRCRARETNHTFCMWARLNHARTWALLTLGRDSHRICASISICHRGTRGLALFRYHGAHSVRNLFTLAMCRRWRCRA